ncbi:MAG: hypothetical protein KBD21_00325 [Candidatus Pacebacteria bacterium]|nr:hypothetical protein [Candidatus Paceibacterota bacterium]
MATRFRFELAQERDEEPLRDVMRKTQMQGSITLAFERELNYFWGENLGNDRTQVVVVRDSATGNVVGCGSRSVRRAYVDEQPMDIGYLGGLRVLPEIRGGTLLARGYRFLRSLHNADTVPFYITAILSENAPAERVLTTARAGLPVYAPLGTYITGLIPLVRFRSKQSPGIDRMNSGSFTTSDVIGALNAYNRRWQFAPHYTQSDLEGCNKLRKFSLDDLYISSKDGEILGTIGVWDQHAFKQTVVRSYSKSFTAIRPLYNIYATLRSFPHLPPAGSFVRNLYGSFISVKDDDPRVFRSLIDAVRKDWSGKGYAYLAVGFHENHPLTSTLIESSARLLKSILYLVYWPSDEQQIQLPQQKIPHVEIATL